MKDNCSPQKFMNDVQIWTSSPSNLTPVFFVGERRYRQKTTKLVECVFQTKEKIDGSVAFCLNKVSPRSDKCTAEFYAPK